MPRSVAGAAVHCIVAVLATVFSCGPSIAAVNPPVPPPTFAPHIGGQWGPVIEWPHVPVTMANLPDGRILTFASNERNSWPASRLDEYTHAAVWDPEDGSIKSVPHPGHDLFCAAVVTLESGETFIMGGRNAGNSPWVSYYDFHGDRWVQLGPSEDMIQGRWYPTAVYMGSGKVFIAGGIGGGAYPELWTPGAPWKLLSGIDLTSTMLSLGFIDGSSNWPLLQLNPNGTIFHLGATATMNQIDPVGGIGGLGSITDLGPHQYGWFPDEGISVLYDVGKILVAGGSTSSSNATAVTSARRIDINGPGPVISPAASMNFPRQFMNEVILPTGDVLAVGGNTNGVKFNDSYAIVNPEVWDPDSNTWTLLNPQDQARTYHSSALLLLDGRVVSGGGGLNGDPCNGLGSPGECGVDHWNAEVFSPPYLFNPDGSPAARPVISSAPRVARVGRTITVHASPGLSGFSMIRMSATTHTMNTDLRFLRPASIETSPGIYSLTLHENENVIVPGHWMLFGLDGDVPSIAKAVQIVNDGTPRGPPIDGKHNDVGDEVLFQVEIEDPDGNPITFFGLGLPSGLSISPTTGVIQGALTTPGLSNVSILASDGTDGVNIGFQWAVSTELSESGTLTSTPNVWNPVLFEHAYDDPVVVMGPPGTNDPDPVTVRVRNVTSTSFEYRIEEWPYLGGGHGSETIFYLVVEAGEYTVPGGGALVAGITTGVDYENPVAEAFSAGAFAQTPSVLTQIATTKAGSGSPSATTRVENVSSSGFSVRIQEQEQSDQNLPAEDVHWIAVEPMVVPGLLQTAISPTLVDETSTSTNFDASFSASPHLFANMQTFAEVDPATLRRTAASSGGFTVVAQEETSADGEVDHAPEAFGWLAIDPLATTLGLLPLFNEPPTVVTPANQTHYRGDNVSLFVDAADPEGGPLTFSSEGLPPGLEIDTATGEVFGTLSASGSYVVTATVTDPSGDDDFAVFLWTVQEPLELVAFPTPPQLLGALVHYEAVTNLPGAFEFEWDFGDGSPPPPPSSSPAVEHSFPGAGRYLVTLTVRDPVTSQLDMRQFIQIVSLPPTASAPTASSSIVYEPANDRVWAVNPDNDSVAVIDALGLNRIAEIAVADGPRTLAVAADGRIWVACREASIVQVLDPQTLGVIQTIPLKAGTGPYGIVFDPAGTIAFVALEGAGQILRLDGLTGELLTTQQVGRQVRHLSVSADGTTLRATRFVTPPLPNEGLGVPEIESGGAPLGGEILSLDTATLAMGPTTILRVNQTPDSEHTGRGVPNYLGAPVISPDGTHLLVPSKQDNVLRGGFRDGLPVTHDSLVRAISSYVALDTGLEVITARLDYDNASVASATIFSALGAYAFTTLEGNRQLAVVDPLTHVELGRVETGRAPHGIVLSPDGSTLFVDNFMDRSVSVFDLSPLMDFNDADLPLSATIPKVVSEALPANVLLGKQLFYDAADPRLARESYMACAACHADGGQDGRTWDLTALGQGLRNTISLEGHGTGQGPLHWTGNFDEVQDFEGQIRAFGGTGLLSESDFEQTEDPMGPLKAGLDVELDALAAYVESLTTTGASPARATDGSFTPDALTGRALFISNGCSSCHLGPEFTDSASAVAHDVGTLKAGSGPQLALDTPTLRGLWRTAPYLHDGSAATLEEAVAAHDSVSLLPAELASLASYLEQVDDAETSAPNEVPVVVVTSPSEGAVVNEGMPVDLVATATDFEDGDLTASIVWSSDLDGVLGSGGSLSISGLSAGSHHVTASVTDSGYETGEDHVTFTVLANVGPTVTITSPADGSSVTETLPVSLTATATDPEDGDLGASIVWTSSLAGPLGTGPSLTLTTLAPGVHTLTAFVVDAGDLPDSESVELTITVNAAPNVVITAPSDGVTRTVGIPVDLVATADDPEDGDLTTALAWTSSLDGALGTGGTLSLSTLSLGTHIVTTSVSDSLGLAGSAQITLTIAVNEAPTITITSPVDGSSATEGTLVDLASTAQDSEDGDLSASIAWTSSLDGALGSGGTLGLSTLSVGLHTLTASVADQHGLIGTAQVALTVAVNEAPTVTITSPADGSTATEGVLVELVATATDPEDGDLTATLAWISSLDGDLGTGATLGLSTLTVGTHTVIASTVDSLGLPGTAQIALTIVVNEAPAIAITAPADGTTAIEGTLIELVATATDPEDGDLASSVEWTSSRDGVLGSGATLGLTTLSPGTHTLIASVVDSLGLVGSAQIALTIAVNVAPSVAITSPADGSTVTEGVVVDLVATASDEEDGDLTSAIAWSSSRDGALGTGGTLSLGTLSVGAHTLTASASDGLGLAGSAQIALTIAVNAAPNVVITAPVDGVTRTVGVPVDLVATADDPEDGDLSAALAWTSSLDGALGTGGTLSLNTLSLGTHIVTASVSDGLGLAGSAQITLTIAINEAPNITITSPVDGSSATEATVIDLIATAQDSEDGDLSASIAWTSSLDGELGSGGTLSLSTLSLGVHTLTASASDQHGLVGTAQIALTVAVNEAPTVTITSPADGSTATEGAPVELVATATDPEDGDLTATLAWSSSLDGALGTGATLDLNTLSLGTHTVTASVFDGLGLEGSDQITLTIAVNAAPTVTITSPADGTTAIEGTLIELVATADDPEDGDLAASVNWTSSLDGALGSGATLGLTTLSPGTHTVIASVSDQHGLVGAAQIALTVAVNEAPTVTVTSPAGFVEILQFEALDLAATALDPEDGDLGASIVWTSDRDGPLGSGAQISVDDLSLGVHGITAMVTDGHGASGSAATSVSVPEPGLWAGLIAGTGLLLVLSRRRPLS